MKQFLPVALLAALVSTGCASVICKKAESTVATRVADVISEQLACENTFAVQAAVLEKIESVGFCKSKKGKECESAMQGTIADFVCPTVANFATSFVSSKVPASWQCSKNPAQVPLRDKVLRACQFIPFKPGPVVK